MSSNYEDKILTAVDMLVQQAVSNLNYDRTVEATIYEVVDEALGTYRVKYQDSVFTATDQSGEKYGVGTLVYVLIPGNEVQKDRFIIGSTDKLKAAGVSTLSLEDRFSKIGTNLINGNDRFGLASYKAGGDTKTLYGDGISLIGINQSDIDMYSVGQKYLMISADFSVHLPAEQQSGNGDYGIMIEAAFEDEETGEEHTALYFLNVYKMTGRPYADSEGTHQYAIFDVNGKNFKTINKVYAYCKSFPKSKELYEDDIFIENIEVYFVERLSEDQLSGAFLNITTPLGSYWNPTDTTDKILKAEVKLDGSTVNNTSLGNIEYYWFKRDLSIRPVDNVYPIGYSYLGGNGWRCLNPTTASSTTIDVQDDIASYVPMGNTLTLHNNNIQVDCPGYETEFKCVAILSEYTVNDTITVINQSALNNVTIVSSEGATSFPFSSVFNVDLEAQLNGAPPSSSYSFVWAKAADGKELEIMDDTSSIIHVNPNEGTNIITYYVEIFLNGVSKGIGSITFTNASNQSQYVLTLLNADAVYKYDNDGIGPTSPAKDPKDIINILPIGFTFYDNAGHELLTSGAAASVSSFKIRWLWPAENTLISTGAYTGELVEYNGLPYYAFNVISTSQLYFPYEIAVKYDSNKTVNTIYLEITYGGVVTTASSTLLFTKEGDLGTNGTKYITRLVPQVDRINLRYVYAQKDSGGKSFLGVNNDNSLINIGSSVLFTAEIYDSSRKLESSAINTISWDMLPGTGCLSVSNGTVSIGNNYYNNKANILQTGIVLREAYQLNPNDPKINYGSYAIPFVYINSSSDYTYVVEGGWREAVYSASGGDCNYDNTSKFTVKQVNKITGDIILVTPSDWYTSWNNESLGSDEQMEIKPPSKLNVDTNTYIRITIGNDYIVFPVHLHVNRYSMNAMNNWDGNNLLVDAENNKILAAQIAAGKKNNNNTFTGIAIGETFQNGNRQEIGLFSYNNGARTIFLNANNGEATFGASTAGGQMVISPEGKIGISYTSGGNILFQVDNNGKMTCKSGEIANWSIGTDKLYTNNATYSNSSNGMYIGTNGISINNKFKVSSSTGNVELEGKITATSGKIGAWNINMSGDLYNGTTYLYNDGEIYCNNVDLNGKITATSGKIGAWNINTSGDLYNGTTYLYSNGKIYCKNVDLEGKIEATSGSIAGWNIISDAIYRTNSSWGNTSGMYFGSDGLSIKDAFKVDNSGNVTITKGSINISNKFKVDSSGNLTMAAGSINLGGQFIVNTAGSMICSTGKIGDWTISANAISAENTILQSTGLIQSLSPVSASGRLTVNIYNGALEFFYGDTSTGQIKSLYSSTDGNGLSISGGNDAIILYNNVLRLNGYTKLFLETANGTSGGIYSARINNTSLSSSAKAVMIGSGDRLGVSSSTIRYKFDVNPIGTDKKLDPHKILNIDVVQFKFKPEYDEKTSERYLKNVPGMIAEEVDKYYSIAVDHSTDETGKIQADNWNERYIIPPMLALIQEHHKEIQALKEQIKELKGDK